MRAAGLDLADRDPVFGVRDGGGAMPPSSHSSSEQFFDGEKDSSEAKTNFGARRKDTQIAQAQGNTALTGMKIALRATKVASQHDRV